MLSRSDRVKELVTTLPVSSGVVARYVPGESTEAAVRVVGELVGDEITEASILRMSFGPGTGKEVPDGSRR